MPVLDRCCGCASLKTGTIFILFCNLALAPFGLIELHDGETKGMILFLKSIATIFLAMLFCAIFLGLCGVFMGNQFCLLPILLMSVVGIMILIADIVIIFVSGRPTITYFFFETIVKTTPWFNDPINLKVFFATLYIFMTLLFFYFWLVVYSYFRELIEYFKTC